MSGAFMFAVIILSVVAMVLAISKWNQHPFLVLTIIAVVVGLLCGMDTETVITTVKNGFGNILASIGIVILCGTIIGTVLEKTGAALTMANSILKVVGKKNSVLTMGLTGYVTGIPVFCDSGFVILSPISRALASQSNISLAVMATALSGGLYATHCLVPPTPGPIAMAGTLEADLGLTILIGLIISIPATAVAILYAKKVSATVQIDANPEYTVEELQAKYGKLPGVLHSFSPILLPIILIAFKSVGDFPSNPLGTGMLKTVVSFIGNPVIALLIGVYLSFTLIPKEEKKNTLKWVGEGVTNSAGILAITGAGGSFGAILQALPIADQLTGMLGNVGPVAGIIVAFAIASCLKLAMGASTVAMITTSAMVAPMMAGLGLTSDIAKVLMIMAIGAGSMTASHANDSYFWVVSQFSDMNTSQAYKCQTGMTAIMGITTIIVVTVLAFFFA